MKEKIKVLYISYDGMTDPLGQSQVIPYLGGLVKKGCEIHILSAEKKAVFENRQNYIAELLKKAEIFWHPIFYTKKPPVLSTVKDIFTLIRTAKKLHKENQFDIVHCRSYISAFAGLSLKKKFNVKFLFDMRGFYADERVDGNLWPQSNFVYKSVYRFFKRREKVFFKEADHTVSLTYAGERVIRTKFGFPEIPIEVIPCCADLNHFNYHKTDAEKVKKFGEELGIADSDFVLSYLGSVGTWYMPDEMMQFFKILKQKYTNAKFLFITRDEPSVIHSAAERNEVNINDLIIKAANREDVPTLISLSTASMFFIKPVFSKKASSPTKLAELLGMGIPVICNAGVGDIDKFVPENKLGILISQMNEKGFAEAVEKVDELLKTDPEHLRNVSQKLFSLETGTERYFNIYKKLCGK